MSPFTAVVLAAGRGARLGARTVALPKPAILVAGRPLLAWDIAFARRAGAARVAVVTGAHREISEPLARGLGADPVLWNPGFAAGGSLLTLAVAREAGATTGGFLLMNADHLYPASLARAVAAAAAAAAEITAFVDRDRRLGDDDMKAALDARGRVRAMSKRLPGWDAGYVGLTFVPVARLGVHEAACARALAADPAANVEAALDALGGDEAAAAVVDVSGHGWYEIDDEADLARAEAGVPAWREP